MIDTKIIRNRLLGMSKRESLLDLRRLFNCKLGAVAPAFTGAIAHVVSVSAQKPVTRPHAQSVIAIVTDVHGVRVAAMFNEVGHPGGIANDVIDANLRIGPSLVASSARSRPRPTSIWIRGFINFGGEVFQLKFRKANERQWFCLCQHLIENP